jgi:alpha-tubulin suppressor-like RCC1 family protein
MRAATVRRILTAAVCCGALFAPSASAAPGPGTLLAFGVNDFGQLGTTTNLATNTANPIPAAVPLPGPVTQAAAGAAFALALTSAGQLYGWGINQYGQLGNATNNGTTTANPTPTLIALPGQNGAITRIAAGFSHALVATSSGQLYAFGADGRGQLGYSTAQPANPAPTLVSLPGQNGTIAQIAAGAGHSLVLTTGGQLYAFGANQYGQLGISTATVGTSNPYPTPTLVTLPGQAGTITQIAASESDSLVATSSGQLYSFGENNDGQLGNATNAGTMAANFAPALVTLPGQAGTITQIVACTGHMLALTSSGQLYAFGSNSEGQLGNSANLGKTNSTPMAVTLPGQVGTITRISGGVLQSYAVTSSGQLFAFGDNNYGELGNAAQNAAGFPTPLLATLPPGTTIDAAAPGGAGDFGLAIVSGLALTSSSLPGGQVAATYAATPGLQGGTGPYTWAASGLPAGLGINAGTGAITGVPSTAGSFTVTVTVTDAYGSQTTAAIALAIAPAPTPRELLLRCTRTKVRVHGRTTFEQRCTQSLVTSVKMSRPLSAKLVRSHRTIAAGLSATSGGHIEFVSPATASKVARGTYRLVTSRVAKVHGRRRTITTTTPLVIS